MVELTKKRVSNLKELKKIVKNDKFKSWNLKTHDKEYYYVEAVGYENAEGRDNQMKSIRNIAKRNGYIELTEDNIEAIEKIFQYHSLDKFHQGTGAFFVWEYSGVTKLLDSQEEREELFKNMSEADANAIVFYLHSIGLTQANYFINIENNIELTRKKEMNILNKDGRPIMIKKEGQKGNPYPQRRAMDIDDFSLSQIKKAMKELKIKIKTKKLDKKEK